MSTYQKILLLILFAGLALLGLFFYRQEQIKVNEIKFKENQKELADCKYILNNKELFLEKVKNKLQEARIWHDLALKNPASPNELEGAKKFLDKTTGEFLIENLEYERSSEKCRNLLEGQKAPY
ncbi:hypothetical protein A3B50_00590 [Candidatus Roizmanbacteria bacterium RIFCSPLOWO2_01_FULL_40_42]|uniref:Uncharacterized protein n=1 Tax=Candidatus Roizmanbacteria bacterium RIFCSPLOWO2_01_FULL_40_42 TaxID=1802066 RepID=A0A1F7J4X2_9BACT|nr:MAG: hypothetical protein A2779_01495 [Candidatus Roizmanbacteria bacterium RIFCSPHIGHO2_01_FULL_40_98]OGK29034.1 MAG: hypothetical protein A3C31_02135 [Candidatus Roizmanbacteria bacterium RIFCSPHIGHO2_02_FULL_40_53]OGK36289.1 MAG: hypothetical protein A3E69_03580 [Candidatus Roizmanbacteria bacterium RIFCSPHIGHO2_12_FULL_40_130]OGK50661.1 MAG: hypothetical protein A3B50_00590 [Candidatus Roizmanbacteria bacterium RIFCSPLOWO2_01_FULL_40_42]